MIFWWRLLLFCLLDRLASLLFLLLDRLLLENPHVGLDDLFGGLDHLEQVGDGDLLSGEFDDSF